MNHLSCALRRLDHGNDRRCLPMHIDTKCLDMRDMDRNARIASNLQRLFNRVVQPDGIGRLIAKMGIIDAALAAAACASATTSSLLA